jgi:hypothetical protein
VQCQDRVGECVTDWALIRSPGWDSGNAGHWSSLHARDVSCDFGTSVATVSPTAEECLRCGGSSSPGSLILVENDLDTLSRDTRRLTGAGTRSAAALGGWRQSN